MIPTTFFSDYRIEPTYPTYPHYHRGLYLEDYFLNYYYSNNIQTERILIPVSWTSCYNQGKTSGLQNLLDNLDQDKLYFTVSQHDDAIKEKLPKNTISFCAGGNKGGIPIPLVCSPLTLKDLIDTVYIDFKKDLLCSFYGSNTHPIRLQLLKDLEGKPNTIIKNKPWRNKITDKDFLSYIQYAVRSKFLLCPRGYGLNSFRLYESFQLGCVPVIISNKRFLPWEDELDWSKFSIFVTNTKNLYQTLEKISDAKYNEMLSIGQKLYKDYFSMDGVCKQIIKRLS